MLLADDHLAVRAGIRGALEKAADIVVVGEAAHGEEALCLIVASSYAVMNTNKDFYRRARRVYRVFMLFLCVLSDLCGEKIRNRAITVSIPNWRSVRGLRPWPGPGSTDW